MYTPAQQVWRRRGLRSALCAFVLTLPWPAAAASLLPLRTETAATLPSGTVEVVLGASYFKDERFPLFTGAGAIRDQDRWTVPEIGLRVAAGSWAEVQATFEFINLDEHTTAGAHNQEYSNGDARLFTKVRILSERARRPGIGLRFGAKLPNANKDKRLGTDETDFAIEVLGSKDFGPLATHVNLGILLAGNPGPMLGAPTRNSDGQDDLFTYAVGLASRPLGVPLPGSFALRLVGEVTGLAGSRFDNERSAARFGLQLQRGGLTLYTGVSAGLVTGSENVGASFGAIYAFELERFAGLLE